MAPLQVHINPNGEVSIFRQIVRQVTEAIVSGHLRPGDKLPSHRDLAADIVVAPLTVKKAYDLLEQEGLIESQRGRGTFVRERLPAIDRADVDARIRDDLRRLVVRLRVAGLSRKDLIALIDSIWKDLDS